MTAYELRDRFGTRLKIEGSWVRLGRAEDNNIVMADVTVSRYHLNFYIKDGKLIAEDAGSQHGFYVNGNIAQGAVLLSPGDRIAFGNKEFEVHSANASSAQARTSNPRYAGASVAQAKNKRMQVYGAGIVLLLLVGLYAKQNESDRKPATVKTKEVEEIDKPLAPYGSKESSFVQKTLNEVQAEGRFREALRDYYNGNYSRAMLGLQEAKDINPEHQGVIEYIERTQVKMDLELKGLLEDCIKSQRTLQFKRAKAQAARILSILSDHIPAYSRKIAQEAASNPVEARNQGQEETLLKLPCELTLNPKYCKSAMDILVKTRQSLGDEDTLK